MVSSSSSSFSLSSATAAAHWQAFHQPKCLVVKVGSQLLMDDDGRLAIHRIAGLVQQCAKLHQQGCNVVLVSSGAIALGQLALQLPSPLTEAQKRCCAAVGQAKLMQVYEPLFQVYAVRVAQVLINTRHFSERWHYVKLGETLQTLLQLKVCPIVNENDTVADPTYEGHTVSFGDNDKLAALLAVRLGADGLVILSNVEGVYTANPFEDPSSERLPLITDLAQLEAITIGKGSAYGRGGMGSKLEAAKMAALCGVPCVIASGLKPGLLTKLIRYEGHSHQYPGTYIAPLHSQETAFTGDGYKRWLAFSSGACGILTINAGAAQAIQHQGASLLPVGLVQVQGQFLANQVVSIQDENAHELGRGLALYPANELQRMAGLSSRELQAQLGYPVDEPVIAVHRSRMVVF